MTPPSESSTSLIPEAPLPVAEARVDSIHEVAAEPAPAAQPAVQPPARANDNLVKIVGIIAGSFTVVAVAALLIFGNLRGDGGDEQQVVAADQVQLERFAERAAAQQAAAEQAEADSIARERAKLLAHELRVEAELLSEKARAVAAAKQPAKSKPKAKPKPKPKTTPNFKPRDAFEDL